MKKKTSKKAVVKKPKAGSSIPSEPVSPPIETPKPVNVVHGPPPPHILFQLAEEETDYRALDEYSDTIRLLKEKGFSFREIAKWLQDHEIDTDHNEVYRVYTKNLSDRDLAYLEREEDEEARDEAYRNKL